MSSSRVCPVICLDDHHVVSGWMIEPTELGCEVISTTPSSHSVFAQKMVITLNVLNSKSGESQNVRVRLTSARRVEGTWVYRIRWSECPELVRECLGSVAA